MKVNDSALRHGLCEEDILHAAHHPVYLAEPDEAMPAKQIALGFDTHGRLIELVILTFDSGNQLVIHAMKVAAATSASSSEHARTGGVGRA